MWEFLGRILVINHHRRFLFSKITAKKDWIVVKMGFNSVYQLLMDQFPTVDARVLRAVAIEHSSDPNQAFCVVYDEILPRETQQNAHTVPVRPPVPPPALPVRGPIPPLPPAFPMRNSFAPTPPSRPKTNTKVAPAPPTQPDWSWSSHNLFGKVSTVAYPSGYPNHQYPLLNTVVGGSSSAAETSTTINQSGTNSEKSKTMLSGDNFYKPVKPSPLLKDLLSNEKSRTEESGFNHSSYWTSSCPLLPGDAFPLRPKHGFKTREKPVMDMSKLNSPASGTSFHQKSNPASGFSLSGMGTSKSPSNLSADRILKREVVPLSPSNVWRPHGVPIRDMFKMNATASGTSSQINSETFPSGAGHVMKTSESKTDQPMSKLLGELIKDAEKDKTNVISAMQSAVNIMKEVETKKQKALWAKVEAAGGGVDILAKVEIIQKQLQKLVETNGKLAREVKESKSKLTTESSEIQSCLLKMSEEKDKSISVLDDMHHALEAQLAAADQELEKAKLMKQQKEANAQKVQSEELALKKATEEAIMLEQAAKENSKVQKLLQDYRHEVDMLQWDMIKISRDVKSLKEKFDQRTPFRKTSLTLASSVSSQESEYSSHSDSFSDVTSLVPSPKEAALESSISFKESEDKSESCERPRKSPELDSSVSSQESKESTESESHERLLSPSLKTCAMNMSQESEDSADSESSETESVASLKSSLNKSNLKLSMAVQDSEDSAYSETFERVAPVFSTLKRDRSFSSEESEDSTDSESPEVSASHVSSPKIIEPSPPLSASVISTQTVASEKAEPSDLVSVSSDISQKSGPSEQAEYQELRRHTDSPIFTDGKAPSNSNIVEDGWDLCDGSDSDF